MHNPFAPLTKEQERVFDECVEELKQSLDGFEAIAMKVYAHTGQTIASQTYRRWFRRRDVPTRVAVTLAELSGDPNVVGALCPFLGPYATWQKYTKEKRA